MKTLAPLSTVTNPEVKEAYNKIDTINNRYESLSDLNNADYNGWFRQLNNLYNVSIFSDNEAWVYLVEKMDWVKAQVKY